MNPLVLWVLRTRLAAWISSANTTRVPRPRLRAGGDLHGGQQVGWSVGTGQGGVAHRPGDHHRLSSGVGEVEQVGGLLDGVGALGDHHPVRPVGEPLTDRLGQRGEVIEGQRRARHPPEVLDLNGDGGLGQAGHGGDELFGGQRRYDPAGLVGGHGDRAAQTKHTITTGRAGTAVVAGTSTVVLSMTDSR